METIFQIFLILHIAGGAVGLLSGLVNVVRKKGDKNHVKVGKLFFFSMLTAGLSSLVLAILHPNHFLFMVGVFTLYMVSTGNRYLSLKQLRKGQKPKPIDWIITIIMLLAGLVFIALGTINLINANFFGLVFVTFGALGMLFVRQDFQNYRGKAKALNYWLLAHLQRMIGAFIAALTAFLVVNAQHLPNQIPGFLYWLLPTLIFTPLIISWSRKREKN
ncbi:MAG: DUF2306 domain-containing protein [Bacteroidetes bacterium]|nr:DUF2306 domain-containing protein [Bacteroidota bacterium]